MTDFARINQPRVEKIAAMIGVIRKSGRSQKVSAEDVAALLAPVAAQFADTPAPAAGIAQAPTSERPHEPTPPVPLTEAPHIGRIAMFVDTLPAAHLSSYLLHIGNRLCEIGAAGKGGKP